MRVQLYSDYSASFANEWERLIAETTRYSIQQRHAWIESYLRHYLSNRNLRILAVRKGDGELVCCLCLQVACRRFYKVTNYRVFEDLGSGVNDFFEIPCRRGYEKVAASCIVHWLRDNASAWERLQMSFIPNTNLFATVLTEVLQGTFPVIVSMNRSYFVIDTSQSWEDYFTPQRNQQLRDVRGRINRIAKSGYTVSTRIVREDIAPYLDDFLFHFSKRREIKNEKNSYANEAKVKLIRDVIRDGEKTGRTQMALLEDQNAEIWAYQLDLVDREQGIWYHYAPTFNDKFSQFSPSKVLLFETLKHAFRDPVIKEFNFMRGEADYKKQFTDTAGSYSQVKVVNPHSYKVKFQSLMGKLLGGGSFK